MNCLWRLNTSTHDEAKRLLWISHFGMCCSAFQKDLAFLPRIYFFFIYFSFDTHTCHYCPIKYSEQSFCQELDIKLHRQEAPTTLLVSSSSLVLFFPSLHCMNCSLMYSHYFGSASPLRLPQWRQEQRQSRSHTHTHTPHTNSCSNKEHSWSYTAQPSKESTNWLSIAQFKHFVPCYSSCSQTNWHELPSLASQVQYLSGPTPISTNYYLWSQSLGALRDDRPSFSLPNKLGSTRRNRSLSVHRFFTKWNGCFDLQGYTSSRLNHFTF